MKHLLLLILIITSFASAAFADHNSQASDSGRNADELLQWSRDKLATLRRARGDALLAYQSMDYLSANQYLRDGLEEANDNQDSYFRGALTTKAIQRGLALYSKIEHVTEGRTLQDKTLAHFLFEYYDFIRMVSKRLDQNYYNSNRRRSCFYCGFGNHRKFEKLFISFSKRQVAMVLRNMATRNSAMVYPIGETKAYLASLELTSKFLAADLRNSLFAKPYACAVDELEWLGKKLKKHINGTGGWPSDVHAVNQSYRIARRVLSKSCNNTRTKVWGDNSWDNRLNLGWGENRREITARQAERWCLYNSSIRGLDAVYNTDMIVSGRNSPRHLNMFRESRYVRKLIVCAQGTRWGEGMVDISIHRNNIIGTIHVPRVDPPYFINVESEITGIDFKPRSGSTHIMKIGVIYGEGDW